MDQRQSVVVGGGSIASRKVQGLLEAGAKVRVISPELAPGLEALAAAGEVEALRRPYTPGDLAGAFLAIAATDDPAVNEQVWSEGQRTGCLVNVVDDPQHCNFSLPAVVRRGDMSIAISTGGSSPALARRLRERLEALIPPEYADLTGLLAELRPELIAAFPAGERRLQAAMRVVDSDILTVLQTRGRAAALAHGRELLQHG